MRQLYEESALNFSEYVFAFFNLFYLLFLVTLIIEERVKVKNKAFLVVNDSNKRIFVQCEQVPRAPAARINLDEKRFQH